MGKESSMAKIVNTENGFTKEEIVFLKSLNSPLKIQEFLESISTNREPEGDTVLSPKRVLRERRAHCVEAAIFASMVLEMHGEKPLLLDLVANRKDQDHVICLFKRNGLWGAIAKTNHYCLGYRDPVYKSIRELAMSYFHEYLNKAGEKTLRAYSVPLNMSRFKSDWRIADHDIWYVPEALVKTCHKRIFKTTVDRTLRKADNFTRDMNNIEREPRP